VFASFKPTDEARDAFLALLAMMIEHTRQEPGCELYDFYADGAGGYHLFEIYSDEAALQAHREAEYFKEYRAKVVDMLDGDIGVLVLRAIDVAD
jgi:quinol monooxygenase YgiN